MCAIFGSFDPQKLKELRDLNAYRGEISGSLASLSDDLFSVQRYPNRIPALEFENCIPEDYYQLGHSQAPTTEAASSNSIHPAVARINRATAVGMQVSDYYLWHNGIVKQREMERLNKWAGTNYVWDTQLLADYIALFGFEKLSEIDGCFACVLAVLHSDRYTHDYYIFRNEISPMFIDDNLNISSTRFEGSTALEAGIVFQLDFHQRKLIDTGKRFTTKENPYYFG